MISGRQIRAARALLSWDAKELASKTGLSVDTIFKIETGAVQARGNSLEKIEYALQSAGIEFTEQEGVRIRREEIQLLKGQKGLQQFFDGVYEYLAQHGGAVEQFGVDEKLFFFYLGSEFSSTHVKRMIELKEKRKDIRVRAIICEGETKFLAPEYNDYRWIDKKFFQSIPFYIYGNTLAIIDFQTIPSPTIIILKLPEIAEAYRKQFELFWKFSRRIPKNLIDKNAK